MPGRTTCSSGSFCTEICLSRGDGQLARYQAAAINRFLRETNANPKPFVWTADPDAIIQKIRRGKQVLESLH